ncbi:MAG: hypothetical protein AAF830_08215 [Pseudomonadota bacterium]
MIRVLLSAALMLSASAAAQVERANFDASPFALGTLNQADGALEPTLWEGVDAQTLAAQFESLPVRFEDPAKRMMLRRVLLSPGPGPEEATGELAAMKLLKAAEAGYALEAGSVAELSPGLAGRPGLSRVAAIRDLYRGQSDGACGRGATLREGRQDPFFVRLRAFCYIHANERAAAELTLNLAREEGVLSAKDERMFRDLLGGRSPEWLPETGLQYAAYRKLGGILAADDVSAVAPSVAGAMALDRGLSTEARLAALMRSAEDDLLPSRELEEAAAQLRGTKIGDDLFAMEAMVAGSSQKAGAIGASLASVEEDSAAFLLRTKIFSAEIASLTQDIATVPYASELALASLLNRRYSNAERWMQTVAAEQSDGAERAFFNLARLYSYVQPGPAQRLAGAIGEVLDEPPLPPFTVGDPAAQADAPGDLAAQVELGLSAAASGSRASILMAALSTAAVDADSSEIEIVRDSLGAALYDRAQADEFVREAAFRREALAAVGRLKSDVIAKKPYVPRLKPARNAR